MGLALRCEECHKDEDVMPMFTTRLADVTKRNRQPRWYCPKCRKKHKPVSALTGKRLARVA